MSVTQPEAVSVRDRRPVTVIRPTRGWAALNMGDLWRYRDLLLILAGRDVKLRYNQALLGGESPLTVQMVVVSSLGALVAFVSGAFIFRRIERGFADVI